MGDVVDLKPASLVDNQEFISDMCRFSENILSEAAVRKKHRMTESAWEALALDDELVRTIEAESVRRIRDGSSKREKAQALIVKGPDILDSIASNVNASPRHRVDAIKVLDTFAANGPEAATAGTRFLIQINLGSDTLTFNKSIRPLEPGEIDPDDSGPDTDTDTNTDTTPQDEWHPVIVSKKPTDGGNGNAI